MAMTDVERRNFFRIEVVSPIRFRLLEEVTLKPLTDWMNGLTADISQGGIKVTAPMLEAEVEKLVNQYMLVEFTCWLPNFPKAITGTATIVYFLRGAQASKAPAVTFGLSFVTIDNNSKDVIAEFIRQGINSPA